MVPIQPHLPTSLWGIEHEVSAATAQGSSVYLTVSVHVSIYWENAIHFLHLPFRRDTTRFESLLVPSDTFLSYHSAYSLKFSLQIFNAFCILFFPRAQKVSFPRHMNRGKWDYDFPFIWKSCGKHCSHKIEIALHPSFISFSYPYFLWVFFSKHLFSNSII